MALIFMRNILAFKQLRNSIFACRILRRVLTYTCVCVRERESNPLQKDRAWHKRRSNSKTPGMGGIVNSLPFRYALGSYLWVK